jgi:hypothetical protein
MNKSAVNDNDDASSKTKAPIDQIEELMRIIVDPRHRRPWVVGLVIATLVSLFKVSRSPEGIIHFTLEVTTVTLILIALVWLPALIQVFALSGGRLKTLAGEVELVLQPVRPVVRR